MEVVCHADRGEVFPPFNAKYCCYFVYYVRISVLYIIKRNCDIKYVFAKTKTLATAKKITGS